MSLSDKQRITLQTARSALVKLGRLDEDGYRLILKNSGGGVASSKDLTNDGFGQVMAVFEEMGFQRKGAETYWRDRVAGGHQLSKAERMRYVAQGLARTIKRYTLTQMVANVSEGATHRLDDLDTRQLYRLIEALKGIAAREERAGRQGQLFNDEPTPAAEGSVAGVAREGPARTRATGTDADAMGIGRNASHTRKPRAGSKPAARSQSQSEDVVTHADDIPF